MRRRLSLILAATLLGSAVLPVVDASAAGSALTENNSLRCLANAALGRPARTPITSEDAARITVLQTGLGPTGSCELVRTLDGAEELVSLERLSIAHTYDQTPQDLSPLAALTNLTELDVYATGITDITPLLGLQHLATLSLPGLQAPNVSPLAALPQLRTLALDYADIDFGSFASLDQVEHLSLRSTPASDLTGVGDMHRLAGLDLDDSGVKDLSGLSGATGLKRLTLQQTGVSDLAPLSSLTSLRTLVLRSTPVTNIAPLSSLTRLTTLDLNMTRPTSLSPLSGLTALRNLDVGSTKVTDVTPLAGLTNLSRLSIGWNGITTLSPLRGLRMITELDASQNHIQDLTPVAQLAPRTVNLSRNRISDLSPLGAWRDVELLILNYNRISDFRPIRDLGAEVYASAQTVIVPVGTTISMAPTVSDPQGSRCPTTFYRNVLYWKCAGDLDGVFETSKGVNVLPDAHAPTPTPTPDIPVPPTPTPSKKPTHGPPPFPKLPFTVYNTPGIHNVNGRSWSTTCEPYSQTWRCRTEIWGTKVTLKNGRFVASNGWSFNNLTYLPSPRSMWKGNPLGESKSWIATDGRKWRTECDTVITGRNGCRSYVSSRVILNLAKPGAAVRYGWDTVEVFNNMVLFG